MMGVTLQIVLMLCTALSCNGLTASELIHRVAQKMRQDFNSPLPKTRRLSNMDGENSVIIGAPSYTSHLPVAEAILPGHTLIRPALGMLKSAVKFPHRDLENGAGVYGNIDNLGIRYDGKNERLMYSGFRRSPFVDSYLRPQERIEEEELPRLRKNIYKKPQKKAIKRILKIFPAKTINKVPPKWPVNKRNLIVLTDSLPSKSLYTGKKNQLEPTFIEDIDYDVNNFNQWSNGLHGRPNRNIQRSVDSRLHSSLETLLYVKKLLKKLRGNRRQDDIIVVKPIEENNSLGYSNAPDSKPELSKEISSERLQKLKIFLSSKDDFNHKIYNADAPDHEDYLPIDWTDIKNDVSRWWYYHQEDFKPFIE